MNSVRQKWAMHKSYRRMQKLWQEYISVSKQEDVNLMIQKLNEFLDSFQITYQEWTSSGFLKASNTDSTNFSLDRFFGDCSEVLVILLNTIDREVTKDTPDDTASQLAGLVNKALNVAELILKDEKYRNVVANTPNLINRILLLLEKLDTTEAKKLALRVISTLGETEGNKLEIGRHQGFKKILRLLLVGDEELTVEIVKTIKHLLEFRGDALLSLGTASRASSSEIDNQSQTSASNGALPSQPIFSTTPLSMPNAAAKSPISSGFTYTQSHTSSPSEQIDSAVLRHFDFDDESDDDTPQTPSFDTISMVGEKVSSLVAEVKEMVSLELGKVFTKVGAKYDSKKELKTDVNGAVIADSGVVRKTDGRRANMNGTKSTFIPTREEIMESRTRFTGLDINDPLLAFQDGNGDATVVQEVAVDTDTLDLELDNDEGVQQSGGIADIRRKGDWKNKGRKRDGETIAESATEAASHENEGEVDKPTAQRPFEKFKDLLLSSRRHSSPLANTVNSPSPQIKVASSEDTFRTSASSASLLSNLTRTPKRHSANSIFSSGIQSNGSSSPTTPSSSSDMLKEFMRVQGALKSLTSILSEAAAHPSAGGISKVEVLETICKLLFRSAANQIEFRRVDGYSVMLKAFDGFVGGGSGGVSGEGELFLQDCFNIFFTIAVDGNTDSLVGNVDALELLFRTGASSAHPDIRRRALACIQDLCSSNPLNAFAGFEVGGLDTLMEVVRRAAKAGRQGGAMKIAEILEIDANSAHQSPKPTNTPILEFPSAYRSISAHIASRPVYQYLLGITNLLEYHAVLLIEWNFWVVREYTRILSESDLPVKNVVINIILRSVQKLLADYVARGCDVSGEFLEMYIRLLCQAYRSMSEADEWADYTAMQECSYRNGCGDVPRRRGVDENGLQSSTSDAEPNEMRTQNFRNSLRNRAQNISAGLGNGPRDTSGSESTGAGTRDASNPEASANPFACTSPKVSGADDVDKSGEDSDFVRSLIREQYQLLLEILGFLVEASDRDMDVFDGFKGFDVLECCITRPTVCCWKKVVVLDESAHMHNSRRQPLSMPKSKNGSRKSLDNIKSTPQNMENFGTENMDAFGRIVIMFDEEEEAVITEMALCMLQEYITSCPEKTRPIESLIQILRSMLTAKPEDAKSDIPEGEVSSSEVPPGSASASVAAEPQSSYKVRFPWFQIKVLRMTASVFRSSDSAKQKFCDAGGMEILLDIFNRTPHIHVMNACLMTIGDFFAGHENTKKLLGDTFGYDNFLELIVASASVRPLDTTTCEIILEVATVGNIVRALRPASFNRNKPFALGPSVEKFRANLLKPRVLYTTLLPLAQNRRRAFGKCDSLDAESLINHRKEGSSSSRKSGRVSEHVREGSSASRRGESSPKENRKDTNTYQKSGTSETESDHLSKSTVPRAREEFATTYGEGLDTADGYLGLNPHVASANRTPGASKRRSNSRNYGSFGISGISGYGIGSTGIPNFSMHGKDADGGLPPAEERIAIRNLVGIVFRDQAAARMALRLLEKLAKGLDDTLQHDYFNLLMLLMEVNPRNKELLCANDALRFVVELLFLKGSIKRRSVDASVLPEVEPPPYVDLVPALGSYDITTNEAALILDVAFDPMGMLGHYLDGAFSRPPSAGSADEWSPTVPGVSEVHEVQFDPFFVSELQHQMLYAIERIAERTDPSCYFNFNGVDGSFRTTALDKFPSVKSGYTFSCWVKVTAFLESETGLLLYEDQAGTSTTFELYFKALGRTTTQYCLCIRTQHWPLPPEDFVFDGFDFAETGIWHHIAFVHSRQGTILFVDGNTIQTYSTFNYPKVAGKDKAFVAVIGRKGVNFGTGSSTSLSSPAPGTGVNSTTGFKAGDTVVEVATSLLQNPKGKDSEKSYGGYFCGQIGTIHFTEGLWDQAAAKKVFDQGPMFQSSKGFRSLGLENKEVILINPATYMPGDVPSNATADERAPGSSPDQRRRSFNIGSLRTSIPDNYRRSSVVSTKSQSTRRSFSGSLGPHDVTLTLSLNRRGWDSIDVSSVKPVGKAEHGCTVHATHSIKDVIDDVGGVQVCFPFMNSKDHAQQLTGIRIISSLLYKSPKNMARFSQGNGFKTMYHILNLSVMKLKQDHFDVLFDIVSDGVMEAGHIIFVSTDCLTVVVDLLLYADNAVQLVVLRNLIDMLIDVQENMRMWRSAGFGMEALLEFFHELPPGLHPFALRAVDAMMLDANGDELSRLFDFLAYEQRDMLELKCEVLDLVLKHMTKKAQIVERVRSLGGLTLLITFLDNPSEKFRLSILKMMGILMNSNIKQSKAIMAKSVVYDALWLFLASYPMSSELGQVLIGLALNFYQCETTTSNSSNSDTATTALGAAGPTGSGSLFERPSLFIKRYQRSNEDSITKHEDLAYAEIIRIILELLKMTDHTDLVFQILTDIKRILTPDNMKTLWEHPWIEWVGAFLHGRVFANISRSTADRQLLAIMDSIIQKMMIFDLTRKASTTAQMKGALADNDELQLRIIEVILQYLDANPCLQMESCFDVLRNLAHLYRHLDEYLPSAATVVYHRFASCINHLASHNNSTIRTAMKTTGLFNIRDGLIIQLLFLNAHSLGKAEDQADFVRSFPFEMIADQPKFRESNGLLFLLRILHRLENDRNLQRTLAEIIVHVFGEIPENRKIMAKILDDEGVVERFFSASPANGEIERQYHNESDGDEEVLEYGRTAFSSATSSPQRPVTAPPSPVATCGRLLPGEPTSGDSAAGTTTSPDEAEDSDEGEFMSPPTSPPRTSPVKAVDADESRKSTTRVKITMDEFLSWYYQPDPDSVLRRNAIEQRIEVLFLPVSAAHEKVMEKVIARRNKRAKQIKDRQLRCASTLNRALTDLKSKSQTRISKQAGTHVEAMEQRRKARQLRDAVGGAALRRETGHVDVIVPEGASLGMSRSRTLDSLTQAQLPPLSL